MRVLVACEFSGQVRDAFSRRGHEAWSCDILPTEAYEPLVSARDCVTCECCEEPYCRKHRTHYWECPCIGPTEDDVVYTPDGFKAARHLQCDVLTILDRDWDMMIAFPPCTHLCVSGAKHFAAKRADGRQQQAVDFFMALADAPIPKIAIENPVGIMSSVWREPDQIVQPWMFGDEATKTTCLWLKGLPGLSYDAPLFAASMVVGKGERHVTKGGNSLPKWYNLPPSPDRSRIRSRTFQGLANAMAEQWG